MNRSKQRWWDWPAGILLFVAFLIAALRLAITRWTDDLERVIIVTMIGVLFGLLLGKSKFSGYFTTFYCLVMSAAIIPWQLGMTLDKEIPWFDRILSIGGRLWTTLNQFAANIPVEDPLLFIFAMMIVYWIASLTTAYSLVRTGRPWFGLALICITTLIIEYYDPPRAVRGLIASIFTILIILIFSRIYYLNLHRRWENNAIPVDNETGFDWMRAAVISGMVLVILAWNIPTWIRAISPTSNEHHEFIQVWVDLRERFSNIVAPLSGTGPAEGYYYENQIELGTTISTSDAVILKVASTEPRPGGARYYWRARSYDQYLNGEWSSTYTYRDEVTPINEEFPMPTWYQRFDSTFTFSSQARTLRNFFTPGQPISISRPSQVIGYQITENYLDTATLLAVPPLRAGDGYRVKASIAAPTIDFLKTSPEVYPPLIEEYYLRLPQNFPQNIRSLAQEITFGLETPYEKAVAITDYLRKHITYEATVNPGPSYMDPIEYVLFISRKGFCNYYASAEVLMLRSIGIPARLAVGFAEGEMDEKRTTFTIRSRDAHAWPEVYFTNFGWVEFEPTVIQSDLVRQADSPRIPSDSELAIRPPEMLSDGNERLRGADQGPQDFNPPEITAPENQTSERGIIFGFSILAMVITIALIVSLRKRWKQNRLSVPHLAIVLENNLIKRGFTTPSWIRERAHKARLTPLERSFSAVSSALRLAGDAALPSLTPAEQVDQLVKRLPETGQAANALLGELHRGMYTNTAADLETAQKSSRQITRLARRYWFRRLLRLDEPVEHITGF